MHAQDYEAKNCCSASSGFLGHRPHRPPIHPDAAPTPHATPSKMSPSTRAAARLAVVTAHFPQESATKHFFSPQRQRARSGGLPYNSYSLR